MSSIFQNILGWVLLYKYLTLFIVSFSSSIGIPLPAGSSMIASAAFASQGYLNIYWVMASGLVGNVLGDFVAYGIVRKFGRPILKFLHLGKFLESEVIKKIESVENTYSTFVVAASRFQDQATTVINIVAGLTNYEFKKFVSPVIAGDILQILFYAGMGYFFADNWQSLYKTIGVFSWVIVLASTVATLLLSRKLAKWILK